MSNFFILVTFCMRFNCLTIYKTKVYIFNTRGVAQSGRVSALGAESRRFESCLPDHKKNEKSNN